MAGRQELSILVADDDAAIIAGLAESLTSLAREERIPVSILTAQSASGVLDHFNRLRSAIDAVFLDYEFQGGMNAEEILEKISDPFNEVFVVLISGKDPATLNSILHRRLRVNHENFQFLTKPVKDVALRAELLRIREHFQRRPYPFPLAHSEKVFVNASTQQARLSSLKDLMESAIFYLTALLLADMRRSVRHTNLTFSVNFRQKLTMGAWIQILKDVSKCPPAPAQRFISEAYNVVHPKAAGDLLSTLARFKDDVRDPIVGHGYTLPEGAYARLADLHWPGLKTFYEQLHFSTRHPLFAVVDMNFNASSKGSFDYKLRTLMGTDQPFGTARWTTREHMEREYVYVCRRDGRVLTLNPYIRLDVCPECRSERVFTIDSREGRRFVYRAVCNHRIHLLKGSANFWPFDS